MKPTEYLEGVLAAQELTEDSEELKALREKREEVEAIIQNKFGNARPTIRYGGSKAKGTMNRESFDLDMPTYFPCGENGAGETLEDIFNNMKSTFEKHYMVLPKGSALRLLSRERVDFHVDVVPGRFTDETKTDSFLFCSSGEKKRIKTNLQVHIDHVKNSGVTDAIRLGKLWKVRNGIVMKTFPLELLIIEILRRFPGSIADRFVKVLTSFRDDIDGIRIEDPANPTGNDLSAVLDEPMRKVLSNTARSTLRTIDSLGWESVFGPLETSDSSAPSAVTKNLRRAAASIQTPTAPWASKKRS